MQNGTYVVLPNGQVILESPAHLQHTGLSMPAMPSTSTPAGVAAVIGILALIGGLPVLGLAKVFGATWGHAALWGSGGSVIALILGWPKKASAAQQPTVTFACPDGSLPVNGVCKPPQMGQNDPDSPPGGWVYNATPAAPTAIQAAATALAAANPCLQSSEQLVRNFQAAAGLAQINGGPGWNTVSPQGTDGRYGGDAAKALAQYVPNAPPACYSDANPNNRPSWWGAAGTYTNP